LFGSDYLKEKAHAKVNLTFKILGKINKNYHAVDSVVTFLPNLFDNIFIKKNKKLIIKTYGEFSNNLKKIGGDTIVEKTLNLLKKKYNISNNFEIIIKKNIPLGAGLGGGSADAAAVARLIFKMYNLNINKSEIINSLGNIGADIPACYFSLNQKVTGFGDKLAKLKLLNKTIWILLIKPNNVNLSTKDVFNNFTNNFSIKPKYHYNYKNLLYDINTNKNDLQQAAEICSPLFSKILNNLPARNDILTIPKMTGSGSTIFILFKNKVSAIDYMKNINEITQNCWKKISKVIL